MVNPTLPRSSYRGKSPPLTGFAYAVVPSLALWALIGAAIWAA